MSATTKLITAVLLLLTTCLFAQETTNDKAIVKDAKGISTGMTQKEFDQFKKDYYNKMEKLGMFELPEHIKKTGKTKRSEEEKKNVANLAIKYKINLTAVNEFMKNGIDIVKDVIDEFRNGDTKYFKYKHEFDVFSYDVIIVGNVVDSIFINNTKPWACFNTAYKIKVDNIIKGSDIFRTQNPDTIIYYSTSGAQGYETFSYEKKARSRSNQIHMFYLNNKSYKTIELTKKYCINKNLNIFFTNFGNDEVFCGDYAIGLENLDEVIRYNKIVESINDPANFYRRKY